MLVGYAHCHRHRRERPPIGFPHALRFQQLPFLPTLGQRASTRYTYFGTLIRKVDPCSMLLKINRLRSVGTLRAVSREFVPTASRKRVAGKVFAAMSNSDPTLFERLAKVEPAKLVRLLVGTRRVCVREACRAQRHPALRPDHRPRWSGELPPRRCP